MHIRKETKWLCENSRSLEKFSGQCVVFSTNEGFVSQGESLNRVLRLGRHKREKIKSFVFHVPSKEELAQPFPVVRKK